MSGVPLFLRETLVAAMQPPVMRDRGLTFRTQATKQQCSAHVRAKLCAVLPRVWNKESGAFAICTGGFIL